MLSGSAFHMQASNRTFELDTQKSWVKLWFLEIHNTFHFDEPSDSDMDSERNVYGSLLDQEQQQKQ